MEYTVNPASIVHAAYNELRRERSSLEERVVILTRELEDLKERCEIDKANFARQLLVMKTDLSEQNPCCCKDYTQDA